MTNNQNQPNQYDVVLGGNAAPPIHGAVLGGIEGVKRRLASSNVEAQIAALKEALNYEKQGLNIVIQALEDKRRKIRQAAVEFLQDRNEPQAKSALKNYRFWDGFDERFYGYPCGHSTIFANRRVIEFDIKTGIIETVNTAYAFRVSYDWYSKLYISLESKLQRLQQEQQKHLAKKVEALLFGYSENIEDVVFKALEKFTNLKAIFLGDIYQEECILYAIPLPRVSFILNSLPQLEILKIRGSSDFYSDIETNVFNPFLKHDNLKALTIESDGLKREIFNQVCQLELPALEYLELWTGSKYYISASDIKNIIPRIYYRFPKLKYLGLRNSEYSDEIAFALVDFPIIENLIELNLSSGCLTDEGAEGLLNSPAIHQLDTLDISDNYLSDEMVERLTQLDIEVINIYQKHPDERYCTVGE
ncbi:MAG: HEAT repeat domain-containing protein [Rivularia sp. (in: cyanobacteria)]